MKRIALVVLLAAAVPSLAFDGPYFGTIAQQRIVSSGATFSFHGQPVGAFTNIALIYHEADPANSIIPARYQSILPPESWACSIGGAGAAGNYTGGPGCSVNLSSTIQSYLAEGLNATGNATAKTLAALIAPTPGSSLSIAAGPQWVASVIRNGVIEPLNRWNMTPQWYVGLAWTFGPSPTGPTGNTGVESPLGPSGPVQ